MISDFPQLKKKPKFVGLKGKKRVWSTKKRITERLHCKSKRLFITNKLIKYFKKLLAFYLANAKFNNFVRSLQKSTPTFLFK